MIISKRHKALAFTLIELLSSMTIGLVCIAALMTALSYHEQNYKKAKALSESQDNIRLAAAYLRNSIEQAGFVGCNNINNIEIKNRGVKKVNNFNENNAIKIKQGENTDLIEMHQLSAITANLTERLDGEEKIITDSHPFFSAGDDLMIADCEKAVLFRVSSVSHSLTNQDQRITPNVILNDHFDLSSEVGKIKTAIFFVKSTGRKDAEGHIISALYVKDETNIAQELIPGVTSFRAKKEGQIVTVNLNIQSVDYLDHDKKPLEQKVELKCYLPVFKKCRHTAACTHKGYLPRYPD